MTSPKKQIIYVFREVCRQGIFDLAQYMNKKYDIDLQNDENDFCHLACLSGNLELAQWLYKQGSRPNTYTFNDVCRNKLLRMAIWLDSMGYK